MPVLFAILRTNSGIADDAKGDDMEPVERQELDRFLEAGIIVSWPDLMSNSEPGLIHVEYDRTDAGHLNHLQVWSSTMRGHWELICTCVMQSSGFHNDRIQFENGYASDRLSQILELAMEHQDAFVLPPNFDRQGLLQINAPSEKERQAAVALVSKVFDALNSFVAESLLV